MTLSEYGDQLHKWCLEVEDEGVRLFKSGVGPAKCTGLAIQIVEARREKSVLDRSRLSVPGAFPLSRV